MSDQQKPAGEPAEGEQKLVRNVPPTQPETDEQRRDRERREQFQRVDNAGKQAFDKAINSGNPPPTQEEIDQRQARLPVDQLPQNKRRDQATLDPVHKVHENISTPLKRPPTKDPVDDGTPQ